MRIILDDLSKRKDDSQQRSWALHEDFHIIQSLLNKLLKILVSLCIYGTMRHVGSIGTKSTLKLTNSFINLVQRNAYFTILSIIVPGIEFP